MADRIHARMKYLSAEIRRLYPQFKRYQLLFSELVSLELERRDRDGPMGPAVRHGGAWTVDRVRRLPEDEFYRYEIDGGVLLISPRPSSLHQVASRRIANLLEDAITTAGADLGVVQEVEAVSGANDRWLKVPDVLVVTGAAFDAAPQGYDAAQIVLAVEISETRHGRRRVFGEKFDAYAQAGIDNYWIVELNTRPQLTVFTLAGNSYEEVAVTQNPIHLTRPIPVDVDPSRLLRYRSDP